MPDYTTASRTKDHFQIQLLRDHPEIVSIAPRLKLDSVGRPTGDGIIVIGIAPRNPLRLNGGASLAPASPPIPSSLPAVDNEGKFAGGDPVQVIVEDTGPVVAEMNTARARPCDGGFSVGHVNVTAGTFGGNVRFGANFGFILSNNHVLANVNAGTVGDNVLQPGVADGGTVQNDVIATLTRWVPIDFATGANNEVDCAIAEAVNPGDITRNVQGIGIPGALADATPQQAIRKSGRSTQLTTGTIVSDNATTRTTLGGQTAVFVNQLQYTQMTNGGDSGSLIWDQNSLTVVGLHYAGDTSNSYGNKILRVLALLSRAFTIYDVKGKATHFDEADICLLDQPKGLNKHKLKKAATPKRKSVK